MSQEPTIGEVNKAVGELSEKVDSVLDAIGEFSTKVDQRFECIESEMSGMKSDIIGIKNQMVTKEYLDDKLINLKADMTVLVRKEDDKLVFLTKHLASKKVITDDGAKSIFAREPFPQHLV